MDILGGEQELLENMSDTLDEINGMFKGKKFCRVVLIDDFMGIKEKEEGYESIFIKNNKKISFIDYEGDSGSLKLDKSNFYRTGMLLSFHWEALSKALFGEDTNVIFKATDIEAGELLNSRIKEGKQSFIVALGLNKIGILIILFDDIDNYFEDTKMIASENNDKENINELLENKIITREDWIEITNALYKKDITYTAEKATKEDVDRFDPVVKNHYIKNYTRYGFIKKELGTIKLNQLLTTLTKISEQDEKIKKNEQAQIAKEESKKNEQNIDSGIDSDADEK